MSTTPTNIASGRPRRVLLVASDELDAQTAREGVEVQAMPVTEVLVVIPAPGGVHELRKPDERERRAAEERLAGILAALRAAGVDAEGLVGDTDPLDAIDDALRLFPADEIVLATRPSTSAARRARRIVRRARLRFRQPLRHVVVGYAPSEASAA